MNPSESNSRFSIFPKIPEYPKKIHRLHTESLQPDGGPSSCEVTLLTTVLPCYCYKQSFILHVKLMLKCLYVFSVVFWDSKWQSKYKKKNQKWVFREIKPLFPLASVVSRNHFRDVFSCELHQMCENRNIQNAWYKCDVLLVHESRMYPVIFLWLYSHIFLSFISLESFYVIIIFSCFIFYFCS